MLGNVVKYGRRFSAMRRLLGSPNGCLPAPRARLQLLHLTAVCLSSRLGPNPDAVEVLKSLAGGAPDAFLTTQAKAALDRLHK
jgi:hypothetical protein